MTEPRQGDELTRRYHEASAQDARRPGVHVRAAVRAHAQAVLDGKAPAQAVLPQVPASNQSRWKLSLLASIALVGLTGLLVLQFERGTPEEKELVAGRGAMPAASPVAPASPAPPAKSDSAVAERSPSADSAPPSRPAQENALAKPGAAPRTDGPVPRVAGNETASVAPAPATPAAPAMPSAPPLPPPAAAPATPVPAAPRSTEATAQAAPSGRLADTADATAESAPLAKSASPPAPVAALRSAPAPAASPYAAPRAAASPMQMQEDRSSQSQRSRAEAGTPLAAQGAAVNSLHEAARTGRLSQVEGLIAQGARVNAADEAGRTPLMLAVIHGHAAVVQRLLAAGANPALVDREGVNALGYARRIGREDMVRMIEGGS